MRREVEAAEAAEAGTAKKKATRKTAGEKAEGTTKKRAKKGDTDPAAPKKRKAAKPRTKRAKEAMQRRRLIWVVYSSTMREEGRFLYHEKDKADELLATLASLARRGASAVCDPRVIERELGIKLGEVKVDTTPSLAGARREHQWTDEVTSAMNGKTFKSARYYRGRGAEGASCHFTIRFEEQRLCDVSADRIQKIMGESLVMGSPSPHGFRQAYEYQYKPDNGEAAVIYLGLSGQKCSGEFALTTIGEWK